MDPKDPQTPVPSEKPTLCSVCAWRANCLKKFSFQQGGAVKCPDFTRDAALAGDKK
jgi:hypothetical protein